MAELTIIMSSSDYTVQTRAKAQSAEFGQYTVQTRAKAQSA